MLASQRVTSIIDGLQQFLLRAEVFGLLLELMYEPIDNVTFRLGPDLMILLILSLLR